MTPNEYGIVTAEFDTALKLYVANLDPTMSEGRRWAHTLAFISGMQHGAAVLQNKMAVTTMRVSEMDRGEQEKILGYLVDTCQKAHDELARLNSDVMDTTTHGHA
jgi:hypothetical protein